MSRGGEEEPDGALKKQTKLKTTLPTKTVRVAIFFHDADADVRQPDLSTSSPQEHLLGRDVKRFRGLVFNAHRLVYHSTLGSKVIKKKKTPSPQRYAGKEADKKRKRVSGGGEEGSDTRRPKPKTPSREWNVSEQESNLYQLK